RQRGAVGIVRRAIARFRRSGLDGLQLQSHGAEHVVLHAQILVGDLAVGGVTLAHGQRLAHVDGLRRCKRVVGGRDQALAAAHLLVQVHQVGLLGVDGVQAELEDKVGSSSHGLYSGCLLAARGSFQCQRMLSSMSNMMLLTSTMRDAARYCSSACSMLMSSSFRFTPETSCCAAKV